MAALTYKKGIFVCACAFAERGIPKEAKFSWDSAKKHWYTSSHVVAARLRAYADEAAKKELNRILITIAPWASSIPVPREETPLPFQYPAAQFVLERNRAYLAADPGLGKTIIAIMACNALWHQDNKWGFVYVCPPFLTRNVREEFVKWARFPEQANLFIIPDSMLTKDKMMNQVSRFMERESTKFMLIVDEAHRFKNETSQRTKAIFGQRIVGEGNTWMPGLMQTFERVLFLSGTPMPNRPMELWPILNIAAPETIDFMNRFQYGKKYCAGFENEFGWDFSGASNVPELAKKVKEKFMLRLKKEDVMDLPPKLEEMIVLGDDMGARVGEMDSAMLRAHSPEDLMQGKFANEVDGELHMATYRKMLGKEKVPCAVEFINSLLIDTDESLLVFAYHTDVIDALEANLRKHNPLVIMGSTPMPERHKRVREFQQGESRLFIGNYHAAGVGLTLTRATRVIFVEFDWVPATNDQASDRAHRIGQNDSVTVQYLVFRNSLDKAVLETVFRKKKITKHV